MHVLYALVYRKAELDLLLTKNGKYLHIKNRCNDAHPMYIPLILFQS